MKTRADKLLDQIHQAQEMGQKILQMSNLSDDGVIYAFATANILVINCQDYETTCRFDEAQLSLWQTLNQLKSSIETILIEKTGKIWYNF